MKVPNYFYITRDKTGEKQSGGMESATEEELVSRLQANGLFVVKVFPEPKKEVKPVRSVAPKKTKSRTRHYRISSNDLVLFCRQVATLLGAGVTILKAFDVISKQVASRRLRGIIIQLQEDMEAGLSLHEAMGKHPKIFSELWVNLIESGEASGNLATVLGRLATYLEKSASFRSKMFSALIYPVILMLAGLAALLFLTIQIIPQFATLYSGFNAQLPLLTRWLIVASGFVRSYLLIIAGIFAVAVFVLRKYIGTRPGRRQFERFKFRVPVFGEFFRGLVTERFSSEMATLIESGVPLLYSLEIAEHSVDNLIMGDVISRVKESVREGKTLNQPLEQSGLFEPMTVQMISVGEEIGELAQMFKRISIFYQEYVETFVARFNTIFEPFILIFMGVIIGIMVVGMFMPIFSIAQLR
ncbi:type II secretion system F family protein [Candidatus Omnitrophota bacterium]